MRVWVDPKETAAGAWGATDEDDAPATSPAVPVFERALSTRSPVQYADGAYLTPMTAGPNERTDGDGYSSVWNCLYSQSRSLVIGCTMTYKRY